MESSRADIRYSLFNVNYLYSASLNQELMLFKQRHIRNISAPFLLFYSFFILFAAFHNHYINFQSPSAAKINQSNTADKPFDPFIDENSVCQLLQFSTTKLLVEHHFNLFQLPPEKIITQFPIFNGRYSTCYFFNVDLRAPPSIS